MNISVKSYSCVGMTKKLTEGVRIKSFFDTNCRIGVTEQMKIYITASASFQNGLKSVLHGTRFGRLGRIYWEIIN